MSSLFKIPRIISIQKRTFFGRNKKKNLGICNIVTPGIVTKEKEIPEHIDKPFYYYEINKSSSTIGKIDIKSNEDILLMRDSCKLASNILKKCEDIIQIGITTDDIDTFVHNEIIKANAYPSPLRYCQFPKSVCTSVNNVCCHGIPDDRKLIDGDIINIDITTYYKGFHGDCSKTFLVGNVDERGKLLVQVTEQCLNEAINLCGPLKPFNIIGKCIENHAKKNGLTVIPAFIGHGIGKSFHTPPEIIHCRNNVKGNMLPGMTFTIEPLITLGSPEIEILEDQWTAVTLDNSRSAQFEHTILITENGVEILTIPD